MKALSFGPKKFTFFVTYFGKNTVYQIGELLVSKIINL